MAKRQQPGCGCCGGTFDPCTVCAIPAKDLTITYTIDSSCGAGSGTFTATLFRTTGPVRYTSVGFAYQCIGRGYPPRFITFQLLCQAGTTPALIIYWNSGLTILTTHAIVTGSTCSPFHMKFVPCTSCSGGNCLECGTFGNIFVDG